MDQLPLHDEHLEAHGIEDHQEVCRLDVPLPAQPAPENVAMQPGPPRELEDGPVELLESSGYFCAEIHRASLAHSVRVRREIAPPRLSERTICDGCNASTTYGALMRAEKGWRLHARPMFAGCTEFPRRSSYIPC